MKSTFKNKLLLGAAVTALSFGAAASAHAADQSAAIEAGTATTINGADTFVIDVTNDGEGQATAITFNGAGANSLTVTSDGADASDAADQGELGTISVTDGGGTNTFTLGDATNGDPLTLVITGAISGNVATDANDLNIVVNAVTTNDAGGSTLDVNGNVDLGTGTIALTGDADDDATLLVSGAAAQTITGAITSTTDNTGSFVVVANGENTATFASAIGVVGVNGVEALTVGNGTAGGQAVFSGAVNAATITVAGTTAASSADFNAEVVADTAIAITGAAAGAASANFAGNVTGAIALTKATNDATITYDGAAAQTQTGAITANTDGDGAIVVSNTAGTVTFGSAIGATAGNAVGSLSLASGSTIDISNDVSVNTLTGAGTVNVSASAEVETAAGVGASGTPVSFSVDAGQVLTLDVEATGSSFVNVALDGAASGLTIDSATAGQTITGAITATTAGEGAIIITDSANTVNIVGNIGTSTNQVDSLTVAGATANVTTTTGNLYVETITQNANDSLQLIGSSAQTVSGTVTGGALQVGTGTNTSSATFGGAVSTATLTVEDGATATFNEGVTTTGAVVVGGATTAGNATFNKSVTFGTTAALDGILSFANTNATTANTWTGIARLGDNQATTITLAGKVAATAGVVLGDGAGDSATLLIKKTATFDPTDADGDGTAAEATQDAIISTANAFTRTAGTTLTVGLAADTQAIDSGTNIEVIADDGTGAFATGLTDGSIVLRDTAFVDIQNNTSTAGRLLVKIVNKSAADVIGADAVGAEAADTLLAQTNASLSGELLTIKGNLQGAGTTTAAQDIANSLAPTVDAGAVVGATAVVNTTAGITNTQLASLRDGTETGMMAGNISQGLRAWGQVFGQTGDQDERDGVAGFEVDTYGFAVGLDTETLAENWIWGLAFAYADTEVDSKGVNNTNTEIDSYQVSLYTNYDIDDRTYISGQVGYVWGDNDQTRSNIGGAGLVANSDYDSETWTARLEAGRKYAVGSNTILTPKALVNYQHYSADGYTETGTVGNAGLVVDSEDLNLFEIGVGVDASWDYQNADGSFWQPKIGVGVRHDLIGDEYETTSRFIGAGGNFNTDGFDPAQTTFNVGADVTYFSTTNWELSAGYDFEVKSDYDAHSGMLRAGYKF